MYLQLQGMALSCKKSGHNFLVSLPSIQYTSIFYLELQICIHLFNHVYGSINHPTEI